MDAVMYALAKKLAHTSSTGIKNIEYNELTDKLVFTMADGSKIEVTIHIKEDCASFQFRDNLPDIQDAQENVVYLILRNDIIYQYMFKNNQYTIIGKANCEIATVDEVGLVKPDDETISVDSNGTISVKKSYLTDVMDDFMGDNTIDNNSIDALFN